MSYWDAVSGLDDEIERKEDRESVMRAFAGMPGRGWIRTNCPCCERKTAKPDHKASMGYNTETGGFNCFKCGTHGQLFQDQRESLPQSAPSDAPVEEVPPEVAWGYTPLFEGPGLGSRELDGARDYYCGRAVHGLSPEVGRVTGVGTSSWGILNGRIVVPFPDYEKPGAWAGWVARAYRPLAPMPDGRLPPQYRYARGFKRDRYFYNSPELFVDTEKPFFVVEGALDVHALWPDAGALLGKPLAFHAALLASAYRPIAVCMDGDAWEDGWSLAMQIRFLGGRAGNIRLPPKIDPDEVERQWLDEEARRCLEK